MNDPTDREPRNADLIDLAEAVREAARPEPPRSLETESRWICFELTPELFDQLTGWLTEAERQLGREAVTDVEVFSVLAGMLMADKELSTRVLTSLRTESRNLG
jgi:hypothetical protein